MCPFYCHFVHLGFLDDLQDGGSPPLSDSIIVTVRIDPIPPVFEQTTYSASVAEFTGTVSFLY